MDELGYQSANAIVPQTINQLYQVKEDGQPELPDETEIMPIQDHMPQANTTQDMSALMFTMIQTIERMSAQLVTENALHNGNPNGNNRHCGGH